MTRYSFLTASRICIPCELAGRNSCIILRPYNSFSAKPPRTTAALLEPLVIEYITPGRIDNTTNIHIPAIAVTDLNIHFTSLSFINLESAVTTSIKHVKNG